jgi:hypothetical protein
MFVSYGVEAQSFSWPTPTGTISAFVGVTPHPTSVLAIPQASLCFQDGIGPVVCGQNLTIPAGDVVSVGMTVGQPVSGAPQGPWPATVRLIVNGVVYASVPVSQTNGYIGSALLAGFQQLTIVIGGTPTLAGAVQTVTTQ